MNEALFYGESYLSAILNSFPSPVLISDRNLVILDANPAARALFHYRDDIIEAPLCGELMDCVHARARGGCGGAKRCKTCVIRQTAENLAQGQQVFRRLSRMDLRRDGAEVAGWFYISCALLEYKGRDLVIITLEDVTELMELRNILPICSCCRKIRNQDDYWQAVEEYLRKNTQIRFSHSICPDCLKTHYPEIKPNDN